MAYDPDWDNVIRPNRQPFLEVLDSLKANRSLGAAALPRSREEVMARINRLKANRFKMEEYLQLKVDEKDRHGAADAAMDLRDIDAEILGLNWVVGEAE